MVGGFCLAYLVSAAPPAWTDPVDRARGPPELELAFGARSRASAPDGQRVSRPVVWRVPHTYINILTIHSLLPCLSMRRRGQMTKSSFEPVTAYAFSLTILVPLFQLRCEAEPHSGSSIDDLDDRSSPLRSRETGTPTPGYPQEIDGADLEDIATRLEHASVHSSIGTFETPSEEVFGNVQAGVLTGDRMFVLDNQSADVRIFELTRGYEQSVGGPGRGPGEFVRPTAMAIDSSGKRLYVADGARRIQLFRLRAREVSLDTIVRPSGVSYDMCVENGLLYIHGIIPGDPNTISEYGLRGGRLRR